MEQLIIIPGNIILNENEIIKGIIIPGIFLMYVSIDSAKNSLVERVSSSRTILPLKGLE